MQGNINNKVITLKPDKKKSKKLRMDNKVIAIGILIAIGIGIFLGFRPNAYQVIVQDKAIGAIKDKKTLDAAKQTVMTQLKGQYQAEIKFEEEAQLKKYRAKKRDYISPEYLVTYMRKNMDVLIAFKEIYVEGQSVGIVASDADVEALKEALRKQYYGNKEVEVDFGKKVEVKEVFAKESDLIKQDLLVEKCKTTTPKIIEYEVKSGDSLWAIADRFGVSPESIVSENPHLAEKNVLRIGDIIKAKVNEPLLPLVVIQKDETKETAENKKEE